MMTICASFMMYVFSYYSFLNLTSQHTLAHILLPLPLLHTLSILSAVGFFGLYIQDTIQALRDIKITSHALWTIALSLTVLIPCLYAY